MSFVEMIIDHEETTGVIETEIEANEETIVVQNQSQESVTEVILVYQK